MKWTTHCGALALRMKNQQKTVIFLAI